MKKMLLKLTAVLLAVCLLCSGCMMEDVLNYLFYGTYSGTTFSQMEYQRPDITALETAARECAEQAETEENILRLTGKISQFSTLFSDFSTQYMLAYVRYCQDMSDSYWEKEYTYCEAYTARAEAARDQLMHVLADCPLRETLETDDYFGEGCFDDYEGESIWTDTFQTLMEEEAGLETRYYDLLSQASENGGYDENFLTQYGIQMEELYAEMVTLRQKIATEAGYDSYSELAYDYYYQRDFTQREAISYCNEIRQELVPLYRELSESGYWSQGYSDSTEADTFRYVQQMANGMGGIIQEAFTHMSDLELYDIGFRENKFDGSFETYFQDYMQPFVFVGPNGTVQDRLSFAHEFGHFCNDYASDGSMVGLDVSEIFSQGLEYLSLFYAEDTQELEKVKMTGSLSTYVEQAAYACFEEQVYGLDPQEVTAENIRALFQRTGEAFGLDSWGFDSRMYVVVSHFFVQPLYVISYVVSNDAAMQLYELESGERGAGLKIYTDSLATEQADFLSYLEEAGLKSPFAPGRTQQVRKIFEDVL